MIIVVHGPAACGKTTRRDELKRRLGCSHVVDDWCPHDSSVTAAGLAQLGGHVLLLTNAGEHEIRRALPSARILAFDRARRA